MVSKQRATPSSVTPRGSGIQNHEERGSGIHVDKEQRMHPRFSKTLIALPVLLIARVVWAVYALGTLLGGWRTAR